MDQLVSTLLQRGFDVFQPFRVSTYNEYILAKGLATDEDHVGGTAFSLKPLPRFGRSKDEDTLAVIIGNSRALWPHFLRWLKAQPEPAAVKDPVDTYTEQVLRSAISSFASAAARQSEPVAYDIFWAADYSPERLVDMNRAAMVSGNSYFSEEMYLSVHPMFGSWVAFRAVVVFDLPGAYLGKPPPPLPPLLSDEEAAAAQKAFAEALKASSEVELNCDGMPLEIAHKWAAMRDCVSLGREHKYDDLQSEYHYTKNPAMLMSALEKVTVD